MKRKTGKIVSEAEFRRMWLNPDMTAQQIADRLGVSVQAVRFRAMVRGLPKRRGGGGLNRKIDPILLRDMWAANVGLNAIAAYFGCHPVAVGRRRRDLGLPDRDCSRWNAISVEGFLLAKAARETEAALRLAEMKDGVARAWAA